MTKKDIVSQMADDLQLNSIEVSQAVDSFIKIMNKNISEGNEVYLRGFGSFVMKKVNKKKGQNLQKGGTIDIPAHKKPVLKFCREIMLAVRKLPVE